MNLLNSISIKGRLIFLTGLALVGLLATASIGLFQIARFEASIARDLHALDSSKSVMQEVATANVEFKTQVQEWKNILLRGNDPESFEKYKKQFQENANAVQQRLKKVLNAMQTADSPLAMEVEALLASHQAMLDKYLSALRKR